jgi:RNA polymerase sigma-70 factor, ECF subfamily
VPAVVLLGRLPGVGLTVRAALPPSGNSSVAVLLGTSDESGYLTTHAWEHAAKVPVGCGARIAQRRKDLPVFDKDLPRTALDAYEANKQKLAAFAFALTKDRDVSEDLVQESFLRLVKELNAGRSPENVSAWLFRVCANLAVSRGRHLTVRQRFLRVPLRSDDAPPADLELLRHEENTAVLEGLATLPTDARAALLMAAHGFTGREIATVLGRSEVATRTMMFRARQKLRLYLVLKG